MVNHPPPIMKPQPFSVGVFSCAIAPGPAYLRGFLQTPADLPVLPASAFLVSFRSLVALLLSGLALRERPQVRKGHDATPYRSTSYARTNQAVVFRHRQVKKTAPIQRAENAVVVVHGTADFGQKQLAATSS